MIPSRSTTIEHSNKDEKLEHSTTALGPALTMFGTSPNPPSLTRALFSLLASRSFRKRWRMVQMSMPEMRMDPLGAIEPFWGRWKPCNTSISTPAEFPAQVGRLLWGTS